MDEVNSPQTSGEPTWPSTLWPREHPSPPAPQLAPPSADAAAAPREGRRPRGASVRWAAGFGVAAVLAAAAVLGVTMSDGASGGTAQAARAVLTGSGTSTGSGSETNGGQGPPATAGAFGFASAGQPGTTGARHACIASARHLRSTGHNSAARARLRACARRFLRRHGGFWPGGFGHGGLGRARARLARLAFLARRAEHGQVTVATKSGPKTIAFERGTVQSVAGGTIVVKAADGVTWTWQISSKTRVFTGGHRAGVSALAGGQRIAVAGLISGGTDQARGQQPARRASRILIRPSS